MPIISIRPLVTAGGPGQDVSGMKLVFIRIYTGSSFNPVQSNMYIGKV